MMRKLIIGCGYLGRRVARAWIQQGHVVTALTRSSANAKTLSLMGVNPVLGDLCDANSLADLPESDTVLLAVGFDRTSGKTQQEVHVAGLRNLWPQIAGRCNRLIHISSTSVYGHASGEWVDELSLCEPFQSGGQCCLEAEMLVRELCLSSLEAEITYNILRLSGIYGPDRLLSRIESLRAAEPLLGRPDAWLNLIHVDDAVAAVLACEQQGKPSQTYLITDTCPLRRIDYYSDLARLVSAPNPKFLPGSLTKRGSDGLNKRCSNRKALDELSWRLTYPTTREGLPQALRMSLIQPVVAAVSLDEGPRQFE